ncbi:MAG: transposase [Patescibacteria group bacterium]|nr:transposase [Patescibacteria group bacterium]
MEIYKKYEHNPPHLFKAKAKYFITARTYKKKRFFKQDNAKARLLESIYKGFNNNGWEIEDWVILDNHYHLMVNSLDNSTNLGEIIKNIHKFSALWIKKNVKFAKNYKKIWFNYWDTCISYKNSYFTRINYIWNNPVKHNYCKYAENYKYGSYYNRYRYDREYTESIINNYPFNKASIYDI